MKRLGWVVAAILILMSAFNPLGLSPQLALNYIAKIGRKAGASFYDTSSEVRRITKFGLNEDIDTPGYEIIAEMGGDFVQFGLAAETLSIVSTSANDTAAGTGGRTILISCIDDNGYERNVVANLNGLTPVVTTQTCKFVNRAVVFLAGSTKYNEGDITITQTTSGVVLAKIPTRYATTYQLMFYVPANQRCYIDSMRLTTTKLAGGSAPKVEFETRVYSQTQDIIYVIREDFMDTSVHNYNYVQDFKAEQVRPNEIIAVAVETDTNNTIASGTMELTCIYDFNTPDP